MQKQQKHRKREKKERKRERERRRRRRRRRNGDASSRSNCISLWLRSFNNGGKYPKKKKIQLGWTSKNRFRFQNHDIWVFGLCAVVTVGLILGFIYHGGCWCFGVHLSLYLCFVLQHLGKSFQCECFTYTIRVFKCWYINWVSKTPFLGGQSADSNLIRTWKPTLKGSIYSPKLSILASRYY